MHQKDWHIFFGSFNETSLAAINLFNSIAPLIGLYNN